ncbi:cytochrome c class I [Leptothrix cholodnii SP-6]|uniref:Cytochrome c class I n=2 Tax=Leptothrix cholodnii TaxID=34029 RepID=B1XXR9_LEPCP|nr:cytochrome c class I [Leptothrix cholodnii SP-6]
MPVAEKLQSPNISATPDLTRKPPMKPFLLMWLTWLIWTPPAFAAAQAAVLYHNYCSVCHGDRGDGRSRAAGSLSTLPRDFTSAASRQELTRERIVLAITHGRPGTAMVGWQTQLSEGDIAALADHVLTQFVQGGARAQPPHGQRAALPHAPISGTRAHGGREADAPRAAAPVDMTLPFPDRLSGQARNGMAFYLANCATCHGAGGDGAGPRAYFINPKPRNFVDAASRARLNRVALYGAVSEGRVGTEMPAWNKVITPQQIADVSEYVFQTFIQPQPGNGTPPAKR